MSGISRFSFALRSVIVSRGFGSSVRSTATPTQSSAEFATSSGERQAGFDDVQRWSTKQFFRDAQSAAPVSAETFNSVAELACLEVHESDEQLRRDLGQMIAYVKVVQNVVGDRQSQIEPLVSVAPASLRRPSIVEAMQASTSSTSSSSSATADAASESNSTVLSREELLRQSKTTKESYYVVPAARDDV